MENVRQRGEESGCIIEHIIIDGGSTGDTENTVKTYAQSHPHVRYFPQPGVTKSRAGNEALKIAANDLIGWLEVDEQYNPNTFKRVVQFFDEQPELTFLIGSHNKMEADGTIPYGQNSRYTNPTDLVEFWKTFGQQIILPWRSTFYRKNVHDDLGPYNEQIASFCYDFLLRASESYKLFCVAERFTSFSEDHSTPDHLGVESFLTTSRTYWGTHGRKGPLRYALSSTFHLKFPYLASCFTRATNLATKLINKSEKVLRKSLADRYNKKFFNEALNTPPISVNPESSVEIHSLCGQRDLNMLLLCLKSFIRFYNQVRLVVHDDGTLGPFGRELLQYHIPGIEIFDIKAQPDEFDELAHEDFNVYKAKGVYNHSKGEKVIMMDSDMLFLRKPSEIIDWIHSDEKVRLYGEDHYEHHSKYIEIETLSDHKPLAPKVNAGLICLYPEDLEKDDFLSLIRHFVKLDSVFFAEQVAFCFILSRYPHQSLPSERYVPCYFPDPESGKEKINHETAHLHFMGDKGHKVNELYQKYAQQVLKELKNDTGTMETEILIDQEIIPTGLKISE